jgi:hypothetical protein
VNCSYGRLAGGSACGARFIRLRSHFRNHEFVSRHHLAVGILALGIFSAHAISPF